MMRKIPKKPIEFLNSSFQDPAGRVFTDGERVFRAVFENGLTSFLASKNSGLFRELIREELLIPHKEIDEAISPEPASLIIEPEKIPLISYPWEWSFEQFREAALHTLRIQRISISFNMSLKDASAFNIQFYNGKPIFIDTLSFEEYRPEEPWVAYKQFCCHFLAPLALISYSKEPISIILRTQLDGLPLSLTSKLLPWSSYLSLGLFTHIHLHNLSSKNFSIDSERENWSQKRHFSREAMLGLLDNLENTILKLCNPFSKTFWGEYEKIHNYSSQGLIDKEKILIETLELLHPETVIDLGANVGKYSFLAAQNAKNVISTDFDMQVIDYIYQNSKKLGLKNVFPLLQDLSNPTPNLGWNSCERDSFFDRFPSDLVIAFAISHHLALQNNAGFEQQVVFFAKLAKKNLLIEFVPINDSQIAKMIQLRRKQPFNYNLEFFKSQFQNYFKIIKEWSVAESSRQVFLMEKIL